MVTSELDLLPLMNIFIVLIPLLLLSAVFVQVSVIRMDAPPGAGAVMPAAEGAEPLELAVTIAPEAYIVTGNGLTPRTIAHDPAALQAALAEVVAAHPGETGVRIVPGARTRYDEIVTVMDATRAAGLPQVALAGGM